MRVAANPMRHVGLVMKMGPIAAIQADSPAAAAGILPGDVIRKVDGRPVADPMTLPDRTRPPRRARRSNLTIERKGVEGAGDQFRCSCASRRAFAAD